jgi:hypothetical protein
MRHSSTLYVGLDVHKDSIAAASVAKDHDAAVRRRLHAVVRRGLSHPPQEGSPLQTCPLFALARWFLETPSLTHVSRRHIRWCSLAMAQHD